MPAAERLLHTSHHSHLFQPQDMHIKQPSWKTTGVLQSGHFLVEVTPFPLPLDTARLTNFI